MALRHRLKQDTLGWRIAWRAHEGWSGIFYRARYHSPVVRSCRALVRLLKPWGEIGGGTDCDGMRYAGMSLHWTRAAAEAAIEEGYNHAEGLYGAEVVTGREAREWEDSYVPDTRDRFAESMGY